MNVLIIGSGGREYALGKKIYKSPLLSKLYFAKGNGGTLQFGENVDIEESNTSALCDFALDNGIDLTIVGPENPLEGGIVDLFKSKGLAIFGVNKAHAKFESSKDYTKNFLIKNNIPTAKYKSFTNEKEALEFLKGEKYPIVIKADGLALGKGVFIVNNYGEAEKAIGEVFNKNGINSKIVVIEEFLQGKEVSSICLVSNNKIIRLPYVRDFKKIGENDTGENTGGVGAICPLEDLSSEEIKQMDEITAMIEEGLAAGGYSYTGVLFIGFMITEKSTYVLEFNVRFGDPETEILMEKIQSDLLKHILDTLDGTIRQEDIIIDGNNYLGIVVCSQGYPRKYESGYEIKGIENISGTLIHNATKFIGGKYYSNGGRVLMVIGKGSTNEEARKQAYEDVGKISFENMYYRKDIK